MKKKRMLALLLTVAMAGTMLAGCGRSDGIANFDRLHNMRMTTDYVIYSFSKQPIGQKLLFFVRE